MPQCHHHCHHCHSQFAIALALVVNSTLKPATEELPSFPNAHPPRARLRSSDAAATTMSKYRENTGGLLCRFLGRETRTEGRIQATGLRGARVYPSPTASPSSQCSLPLFPIRPRLKFLRALSHPASAAAERGPAQNGIDTNGAWQIAVLDNLHMKKSRPESDAGGRNKKARTRMWHLALRQVGTSVRASAVPRGKACLIARGCYHARLEGCSVTMGSRNLGGWVCWWGEMVMFNTGGGGVESSRGEARRGA